MILCSQDVKEKDGENSHQPEKSSTPKNAERKIAPLASESHSWQPARCFAVLGYGGNGITFSAIAAQIIQRAVIGMPDPDADLFRLPA